MNLNPDDFVGRKVIITQGCKGFYNHPPEGTKGVITSACIKNRLVKGEKQLILQVKWNHSYTSYAYYYPLDVEYYKVFKLQPRNWVEIWKTK